MTDAVAQARLSEAIIVGFRDAAMPPEQVDEFARNLAASYLVLMRMPNPAAFSASQLEPMQALLQQGLKIETLIDAIDRMGEAAKELPHIRPATTSFATIITKMVAAQANMQAAG